ncbi:MAG TPA: amidohydrolase family protein [Nitrososphaerales archaeon]|nr:amidohydrolase family protein [Nitrososphaerales archaeon]
MPKIIDAHIHLSERSDDALIRFAEMNSLRYTLDGLLESMKQNNVGRGLLLSPPLQSGIALPNEKIMELCSMSGGLLSPVVTVEPSAKDVKAAIRLAESNRKEVKAFKIRLGYVEASALSPLYARLFDYAESEGLPVMFHTGDTVTSTGDLRSSHPLNLDALANRREELTVILCHFGNPWFEDVAELIYKHPKVYADISGLTTGGGAYPDKFAGWLARKISEAIYFSGGPEKIIFGTDYPITAYPDALDIVRRLDLDEGDREMILWRNAKTVFGL